MNLQTRRSFLKMASLLALPAIVPRMKTDERPAIPYVDGLCLSIPSTADEDFRASGLAALIADVSAASQVKTPDGSLRFTRSFEACSRSIVEARQQLRQKKNAFLALKGSEIKEAFSRGKTAVFLQFQGCEPLGEDLSRLDLFYELGLRVLQITHHNNNPFGGGCIEKNWTGLTKLGFEAVERMNALGIIPDLAHVSDPTSLDVLKTSKRPVVVSHGGARALVNNARCTSDEVIRGVAKSGGVMGIFMMSFWLTTDPTPSVEAVIKQLRQVIKVG